MKLLLLCETCQPKRLEVKTYRIDPATCDGCGLSAPCDKVAIAALLECAHNASAEDGEIIEAFEAYGDEPPHKITARVHKIPLMLTAIDRERGWFTFSAYRETRDKALAFLETGDDHVLEVLERLETDRSTPSKPSTG